MEQCRSTDCNKNCEENPSLEAGDEIITLNVGGQKFQTQASTLRNRRKGILYNLCKTSPTYNSTAGEYWFDRDPVFFRYILQYYRTGQLHIEGTHCANNLKGEIEFWGFSDNDINTCCWINVCEARDKEKEFEELRSFALKDDYCESKSKTCRQKLWRFLSNPSSSIPAKSWCVVSVCLIMLSVACSAISTLPAVKRPLYEAFTELRGNAGRNSTRLKDVDEGLFYLNIAEAVCLVFFTMDMFLRLFSAPRFWEFIKSFLFVCDILFLVPGWVIVAILFSDSRTWLLILDNTNMVIVLQLVGLTRVFRVFRLGWYSQGFRILVLVLRKSCRELAVLGSILAINLILFGFLIYTAEMSSNEDFDSAFRGFWWAVTTMSTVGYGDIYPVTPLGYVIGGACAISGIIVIGLLIPIIAGNFRLYYRFQNQLYPKQIACKT